MCPCKAEGLSGPLISFSPALSGMSGSKEKGKDREEQPLIRAGGLLEAHGGLLTCRKRMLSLEMASIKSLWRVGSARVRGEPGSASDAASGRCR